MTELERRAMLGDRQAQRICTQLQIPLPCPCCGGDATWKSDTRRDGNCYYEVAWIECEKCRIRIGEIQVSDYYNGREDPATALSRWNRRVVCKSKRKDVK